MLLTSTMMLTLDGVYQGPGGKDEDRSGGFDRGGWVAPHFDDAAGASMAENFAKADAFLLGRRTYDIFCRRSGRTSRTLTTLSPARSTPSPSTSRPGRSRPRAGPTRPSSTATSSRPSATSRRSPGTSFQVHGSGRLVRFLLEHDLLDRLHLIVVPVIVGAGERLFPERGLDTRLELLDSLTTPSGAQISTYRPAGRATYAEASA